MIPLPKKIENIEAMLTDLSSKIQSVLDWKQNVILEMTAEERANQTQQIVETLSSTLIAYINQQTGGGSQ